MPACNKLSLTGTGTGPPEMAFGFCDFDCDGRLVYLIRNKTFGLSNSVYLPRRQVCRNQEHLLRQINLVGLNQRYI